MEQQTKNSADKVSVVERLISGLRKMDFSRKSVEKTLPDNSVGYTPQDTSIGNLDNGNICGAIPTLVVLNRVEGEKLGLGVAIEAETDLGYAKSVYVKAVAPDSPASRCNILLDVDDEILELNGIELKSKMRMECLELFRTTPLSTTLLVKKKNGSNSNCASTDNW